MAQNLTPRLWGRRSKGPFNLKSPLFNINIFALFFGIALWSELAFAAGGGLYESVLHLIGINPSDSPVSGEWLAVPGGLVVLLIILALGLTYSKYSKNLNSQYAPSGTLSIPYLIHKMLEFIHDLTRDIIGPKDYKKYFGLLTAIFLFILLSNLKGMTPGITSPTLLISVNLTLGVIVFAFYNYQGIKEHGISYLKHFMGPMLILAPVIFAIEVASHSIRPVSLSLRLMLNLFSDHKLVDIFTELTYVAFPVILSFFGLLVAFVQSFVFTLLSGIYISMAISHDH